MNATHTERKQWQYNYFYNSVVYGEVESKRATHYLYGTYHEREID